MRESAVRRKKKMETPLQLSDSDDEIPLSISFLNGKYAHTVGTARKNSFTVPMKTPKKSTAEYIFDFPRKTNPKAIGYSGFEKYDGNNFNSPTWNPNAETIKRTIVSQPTYCGSNTSFGELRTHGYGSISENGQFFPSCKQNGPSPYGRHLSQPNQTKGAPYDSLNQQHSFRKSLSVKRKTNSDPLIALAYKYLMNRYLSPEELVQLGASNPIGKMPPCVEEQRLVSCWVDAIEFYTRVEAHPPSIPLPPLIQKLMTRRRANQLQNQIPRFKPGTLPAEESIRVLESEDSNLAKAYRDLAGGPKFEMLSMNMFGKPSKFLNDDERMRIFLTIATEQSMKQSSTETGFPSCSTNQGLPANERVGRGIKTADGFLRYAQALYKMLVQKDFVLSRKALFEGVTAEGSSWSTTRKNAGFLAFLVSVGLTMKHEEYESLIGKGPGKLREFIIEKSGNRFTNASSVSEAYKQKFRAKMVCELLLKTWPKKKPDF